MSSSSHLENVTLLHVTMLGMHTWSFAPRCSWLTCVMLPSKTTGCSAVPSAATCMDMNLQVPAVLNRRGRLVSATLLSKKIMLRRLSRTGIHTGDSIAARSVDTARNVSSQHSPRKALSTPFMQCFQECHTAQIFGQQTLHTRSTLTIVDWSQEKSLPVSVKCSSQPPRSRMLLGNTL